jgi:hypothetical protein
MRWFAMAKKRVRIEVTRQVLGRLREEVLCNQHLSSQQRRWAVKRLMPLPTDGSPVDLYCDGEYLGAV